MNLQGLGGAGQGRALILASEASAAVAPERGRLQSWGWNLGEVHSP